MATFRRWADLQEDVLRNIGDRLDIQWYTSARGACTAWRGALVPPCPALLQLADGARPYAASLPTRRSFELTAIVSGSRCVGSSNGWLALSVAISIDQTVFALVNPVAAVEIHLPPLIYDGHKCGVLRDWVSKLVFTPSPTKDDFAAAAICDVDRVAYVTAGARRWAVMDPVLFTSGYDQLRDVLYTDGGKVYCLTKRGDVHVLRLPKRCRRKPANTDEAGPSATLPEFSFLQPPPPAERVTILRSEHLEPHQTDFLAVYRSSWDHHGPLIIRPIPYRVVPPGSSQEPHLNAPATVKPLLPLFDPATDFAPPYGTVSALTSAKHLVFCKGNLYQVWRNTSCTVTVKLPTGGQRRVVENEILVLRYYPERKRCCWDVVNDLGGYSFFVGSNNAVSMYAEGVPGLRGNCVYWIGGRVRDQGMVFDMESGTNTPCMAPQAGLLPNHRPHSTICWYFMSDIVMSINNSSSSSSTYIAATSCGSSVGDQVAAK